MSINIRKLKIEDLDVLAKLFDDYRKFYNRPSNIIAGKQFLKERFLKKESEVFVAETLDLELVGFVQLYPIFSSTYLKPMWLLNDLFVNKNFRGKGISKLLINRSKKLCIETERRGLTLETEKTNNIGNNLYVKTGFVLNEESNFYFWENTK